MKFVSAICLFATALSAAFADERPNVIVVITDDQGYGDLSCHGNPVLKTPQLDRLHGESVRFTDYHVAPTCSPTRAAMLTGHWTNRTGVWHTIAGRSMLDQRTPTFAKAFQDVGYRTAMIGKWHLGDNAPCRPQDHGFDTVFYHGGGGIGQTPDAWNNGYFDATYYDGSRWVRRDGFCTDVFFNEAMNFVNEAADEPFLLYLSTNAPHAPMHSPEEWAAPYLANDKLTPYVANFFGMIANIDDNVGKLRAHLEDKGLSENTVFIFTTDNGTAAGEKIENAGMRGRKGSAYDGGHRVPLFVHWPAGGVTDGRDDDRLCHAVDIYPMLLEVAGITLPNGKSLDGRTLPLRPGAPVDRTRIVITDSQRIDMPVKWRGSAVMQDKWRLVNKDELYHVGRDPGQKTNVAEAHAEVVERLQKAYDGWWQELEPTFAQRPRIEVGSGVTELNCHDWIECQGTAWDQGMIRQGKNFSEDGGTWALRVGEKGRYRITVRRWPAEVKVGLDEGIPAGEPQPGDRAYRAHDGVPLQIVGAVASIGGKPIGKGEAQKDEIVIDAQLSAGDVDLSVQMIVKEGASMKRLGALYVDLEKIVE